jgi:Flp pilus assembly protein TadD
VGRYREAIQDYNAVVQLDPQNVHAYHNRGISHDKLGQYAEAVQDFSEVSGGQGRGWEA